MSISAATKRLAATGAATALAAGAVVGGTATAADAAVSGQATYTCTIPGLGATFTVPLSVSAPSLPDEVATELPVPGGLLPVGGELGLPAQLTGLLALVPGLDQLGTSLPGFSMLLGSTAVPVDGFAAPLGPIGDKAVLGGAVGAFQVPAPGTYDIALPQDFALAPVGNVPLPISSIPCTMDEGQDPVVGKVKVRKQGSNVSAVAPTSVKAGKAAKVKVTVARELGGKGAGKVVALLGGKKVASQQLSGGAATLTVKGVTKGVNKIVVKYLGNARTAAARTPALKVTGTR